MQYNACIISQILISRIFFLGDVIMLLHHPLSVFLSSLEKNLPLKFPATVSHYSFD